MHLLFTITAQQIATLRGVCYSTGRKEWHQVRDALSLARQEPLKLRDLAAYWGFCPKELAETLYNVKVK